MNWEGCLWIPAIVTIASAATAAAAIVLAWFLFGSSSKFLLRKQREISPTTPTAIFNNTRAAAAADDDLLVVGEYEVFLSFCGQDTRYGFTDFLYTSLHGAGIHTFRDNEGLHVREEIGPELLKAITDSIVSIPIFSKNYASSKWCLLELEQMVQCHENGGHVIFSIFYNVDPYDVRHQSVSYKGAFCQHRKKRFNEKTIQGWKEALTKVGQLKGLELKKETDGCEGELVKIIVEEVLSKLKKDYKHVPQNLVGMDSHLEEMERLLNIDSNGVRIIGIFGMGGLGKTTIANVIYNQSRLPDEAEAGRNQSSPKASIKSTRLGRGTKNVKALCLSVDFEEDDDFDIHVDFSKLPNLRYLIKDLKDLDGDFNNMSNKLKDLILSHCIHVTRVPDLSMLSTLKRLELYRCSSLCMLDGLEKLESLEYLDASKCKSFKSLPDL
ncbi:hypothetical protein LguiB_013926 [Lonicera macranthoides]